MFSVQIILDKCQAPSSLAFKWARKTLFCKDVILIGTVLNKCFWLLLFLVIVFYFCSVYCMLDFCSKLPCEFFHLKGGAERQMLGGRRHRTFPPQQGTTFFRAGKKSRHGKHKRTARSRSRTLIIHSPRLWEHLIQHLTLCITTRCHTWLGGRSTWTYQWDHCVSQLLGWHVIQGTNCGSLPNWPHCTHACPLHRCQQHMPAWLPGCFPPAPLSLFASLPDGSREHGTPDCRGVSREDTADPEITLPPLSPTLMLLGGDKRQ